MNKNIGKREPLNQLSIRNINEEQLIQEVSKRSVLYDKTLREYRKPGVTDNAWIEIAKSLNVKVEDCKKRWKSLRDTFIKYYRQELTTNSALNSKKKKWLYYDQMSFLKQHVELFGIGESEQGLKEEHLYKLEANKSSDAEQEDMAQFEELIEEDVDLHMTHNTTEDFNSSKTKNEMDIMPLISDPDERFLLSCAPVLKRLNNQKNSLLKMKIQQLMYDVEFGEDSAKDVVIVNENNGKRRIKF